MSYQQNPPQQHAGHMPQSYFSVQSLIQKEDFNSTRTSERPYHNRQQTQNYSQLSLKHFEDRHRQRQKGSGNLISK